MQAEKQDKITFRQYVLSYIKILLLIQYSQYQYILWQRNTSLLWRVTNKQFERDWQNQSFRFKKDLQEHRSPPLNPLSQKLSKKIFFFSFHLWKLFKNKSINSIFNTFKKIYFGKARLKKWEISFKNLFAFEWLMAVHFGWSDSCQDSSHLQHCGNSLTFPKDYHCQRTSSQCSTRWSSRQLELYQEFSKVEASFETLLSFQ